jgi:hypothetical protein
MNWVGAHYASIVKLKLIIFKNSNLEYLISMC